MGKPLATIGSDSSDVDIVSSSKAPASRKYGGASRRSSAVAPPSPTPQPEGDKEDDEEEEDEEGEGYEIERILDDDYGKFKPGNTAYYVSWKGYNKDENSWIDEEDANAPELIKAYQLDKIRKAKARKAKAASAASPSLAARKKRAATTESADDDEVVEVPPAKKSRTAVTAPVGKKKEGSASSVVKSKGAAVAKKKAVPKSVSDDGMDVDEPEVVNEEEAQSVPAKYANMASWEALVSTIDTMGKDDDGVLLVYFTMKKDTKKDSEPLRYSELHTVCNAKFPQKMLEFYEQRLKWKELPDSDDESDDKENEGKKVAVKKNKK